MAEQQKTYTIRGTISTGLVGSKHDFEFTIEAEEWDGMTAEQQEEAAREMAFSYIDWNYEVVEKEAARG